MITANMRSRPLKLESLYEVLVIPIHDGVECIAVPRGFRVTVRLFGSTDGKEAEAITQLAVWQFIRPQVRGSRCAVYIGKIETWRKTR